MKYELKWHQDRLEALKQSAARREEAAQEARREADRAAAEVAFRERQIAAANAKELAAFDPDRFLHSADGKRM